MAYTELDGKINTAYANVETLKDALKSFKTSEVGSANYRSIAKQLKDANDNLAALEAQKKAAGDTAAKKKNLDAATEKQKDLDVALASGDKKTADLVAKDIVKLGGNPVDLDGKPYAITSAASSGASGSSGTKSNPLPISQLAPGEKVSGNNIVDATGKVIGTTDGKTFTLTAKPTITTTGSSSTSGKSTTSSATTSASTPQTFTLSDSKSDFTSYLKSAFAGIADPKSKAMINQLFQDAATKKYDDKTFLAALDQIPWWQNQAPTLKNYIIESQDPRQKGVLEQEIQNKLDTIKVQMGQLGVQIQDYDPVTKKLVDNTQAMRGVAIDAIKNGWDSNQIAQHLGDNHTLLFNGGTLGSYSSQIQRTAGLYGITIDPVYQKQINNDLLDPTSGRDANYYLNEMKNQAMDLYKPFAASIKEGRDLYSITSNYRTQMASLLEVAPEDITWKDLMGKVMDENGNARTQKDFTTLVRQDPLWQKTQNAKDTYSSVAENLMKQFGFVG